jgi:hypothetical protein
MQVTTAYPYDMAANGTPDSQGNILVPQSKWEEVRQFIGEDLPILYKKLDDTKDLLKELYGGWYVEWKNSQAAPEAKKGGAFDSEKLPPHMIPSRRRSRQPITRGTRTAPRAQVPATHSNAHAHLSPPSSTPVSRAPRR